MWSVKMAEAVLAAYPNLSDKWSHEYGVVFKAIEDVWLKTGEDKYFEYILNNIKPNIDEEGHIRGYNVEKYELDDINTGRLLFSLSDKTGDERYSKAAAKLREQFRTHPRTSDGLFWHKAVFPFQAFLDGGYMGSPFYAQYASRTDDREALDDVAKQIILLAKHTKDEQCGLHYHGWDEKKQQLWADPETGCSRSFWGRAMGWYSVGIVDILDYLPEEHPDHSRLIDILNSLMSAVIRVQDPITGVWYQVMDQQDRKGNYLEASASCMFAYSLAKGIRKRYLPESLLTALHKAYQGIITQFIEEGPDGEVRIKSVCKTAGLGLYPHRDGSFDYYISEPIVENDFKGISTFIMASVELEALQDTFK
jgi:unsaturated rhamnogalacturonyl hydrolase